MKTDSLRNIVATASLMAGLAGFSSAQADVVNGSLGAGASATDRYHVTCEDNNSRLEGNVTDLVPVAAPLVSMLIRTRKMATSTTDPVDGFQFIIDPPPLQVPSSTVSLFGGLGVYDVLIHKTAAGVENYRIAASHMTSMGIPRLVVAKILNHAETGVTAVYDRHSYDARSARRSILGDRNWKPSWEVVGATDCDYHFSGRVMLSRWTRFSVGRVTRALRVGPSARRLRGPPYADWRCRGTRTHASTTTDCSSASKAP